MDDFSKILTLAGILAICIVGLALYRGAENDKLYEKCLATQLEIAKTQKDNLFRTLDCSRR